jgi:hypothetical protein
MTAAAQYHQAALPSGWELADEVRLPGGRSISGTAARVYQLLEMTRRHRHRWHVGRHLAPAGWVPTWVLREPWAGGSAGDRRLRDLREKHGLVIDGEPFQAPDDEPASQSWLFLLRDGTHAPESSEPSRQAACPALPLAGITVTFRRGSPVERAGTIDVSPGASSRLAPDIGADDDVFRAALRALHRADQLAGTLSGRRQWVLWCDPAAPYDPFPVLTQVITALGGSVVGD